MAGVFARYPFTPGGIALYPTFASFPASAADGTLALALDTDVLYAFNSGSMTWVIIGGPGAALSVGTYDSQPAVANGLQIVADALYAQSADATHPGMVNISTQTFAGGKTFNSPVTIHSSGVNGQITVQPTDAAGMGVTYKNAAASGFYNWFAGAGVAPGNNNFSVIPSTLVDGSIFSGPVFSVSQAGLTTVGSLVLTTGNEGTTGSIGLNATDGLYFRGKTGTVNDLIVLTNGGANVISNPTGTADLKFNTDGGSSTFVGTIAASNLSGTNTGDLTLAAVGSSPNANAASLSGQILNLQPFDSTHPGVVLASGGGSVNFLRADGTWVTPAGTGVTSVSVATANGLAGSSSGGSTPSLTLSTTITGILQGNGTAISAATTTGSGSVVLATSPALVTPDLGTPSALVGTNITGTASGLTSGTTTNVNTNLTGANAEFYPLFVGSPSSATQAPGVDAGLHYNPSTDTLTTTTFVGALTGNASTVTTNANLTGVITSSGNATSTGSQTGTGNTFVMSASPTVTGTLTFPTPFTLGAVSVTSMGTQLNYLNAATGTTGTASTNLVFSTSPTLVTPNLGTPTTLVGTNITGTATAFTASNVTTNANLTGVITSSGNATSTGAQTGTGNTFVMSAGPTMSGVVTVGSLVLTSGGEGTAGSIGFNGGDGLYLRGKTGSTNDFLYLTNGGGNIISNPTGTADLKFNTDGGGSTFVGTANISTLQFGTAGTTGSTVNVLGTNGPNATTTPNTWVAIKLSDGSTGYMPVWK